MIRRSMPWMAPRTLTDDEVYALTAYVLSLNKLIGENDVMDAQTLPKVKMPNRATSSSSSRTRSSDDRIGSRSASQRPFSRPGRGALHFGRPDWRRIAKNLDKLGTSALTCACPRRYIPRTFGRR